MAQAAILVTVKKKGRKQGGGGTRKYGRNKVKCDRYRKEGRRESNKLRNINRQAAAKERKSRRKEVKNVQV